MIGSRTASAPRTLLIWGLAALAALWLGLTALGAVTKTARPGVALSLVPANGFAYERRAANETVRNNANLQNIKIPAASLDDALAALRREPLASTALTIVGLVRGATPDAAKIIIRANAIDKRQLVANAWLINYHGTAGRSRRVLNLLDEALRVNPALAERYMPAFAQALENRESLPIFQQLLSRRPVWQEAFWQAVSGHPAALPNAEVLRSRMLAGATDLGPTDDLLIGAYVGARRMDLALSYLKQLPALPEDNGNLLRNSSFNEMSRLPPLDWELSSDGRVSAAIDEGRGSLQINAIAGASAIAARQLVALTPGNYVLFAKLGQASLSSGSDIQIHVHCAEAIGGTPARVDVRLTSDIERPFVIPEGAPCRFYWVEIDFSAMDSSSPALASLAEVRIVRGRALQAIPDATTTQ
jgi:hypothetical protein